MKAPAREHHQRLRIEVVEGQISGDSYFKVGSDTFTNIRNIGISRAFMIMPGEEDKKAFSIHFHAGDSQDTGFLIKFTGEEGGKLANLFKHLICSSHAMRLRTVSGSDNLNLQL